MDNADGKDSGKDGKDAKSKFRMSLPLFLRMRMQEAAAECVRAREFIATLKKERELGLDQEPVLACASRSSRVIPALLCAAQLEFGGDGVLDPRFVKFLPESSSSSSASDAKSAGKANAGKADKKAAKASPPQSLELSSLFGARSHLPVRMEICSGYGEWIVVRVWHICDWLSLRIAIENRIARRRIRAATGWRWRCATNASTRSGRRCG